MTRIIESWTRTVRSAPTNLQLMRAFRRSPLEFVAALVAAEASNRPIRIGSEAVLLIDDAAQVWELLTTHAKKTRKGRGMVKARLLLGSGLLTSEGDQHRQHRRALQPAFHASVYDDYLEHVTSAARCVASGWVDGGEVDLVAEMSAITLLSAGSALFGADLREPAPKITAALGELLVGFRFALAPGGSRLLRSPLPAARRVRDAKATLEGVVDDLATGRWATGRAAPVLDALAAQPEITERQVRDEIMTLLLAGHETTAMALTWALIAIDHEPGLRECLELEWAAGVSTPRASQLTTVLPRTTASVAEALRLWPPSWMFTRRVVEPLVLADRDVPVGTMCLVSPALLHRDERWWADADVFRPGRWLREGVFDHKEPGQPRGAYLPFGAGPRMCIGEQFAWVETVAVLAELGRSWRLHLPGMRPIPGPSSMTLRPRGPVRAVSVAR